jgi:hypothetical protein
MVDPNDEIVQKAVKCWGDLEARKGKSLSISSENITVCIGAVYMFLIIILATSICILSNSSYIIILPFYTIDPMQMSECH